MTPLTTIPEAFAWLAETWPDKFKVERSTFPQYDGYDYRLILVQSGRTIELPPSQDDVDSILAAGEIPLWWECTRIYTVGEEGHSDGSTEDYWAGNIWWSILRLDRCIVDEQVTGGERGAWIKSGKCDTKLAAAHAALLAGVNWWREQATKAGEGK